MNPSLEEILIMSTISGLLLLLLLLALVNIFHKAWWIPTRIQKFMALQGIKGPPPYTLVHGSTKEILRMQKENMGKPKSLSHMTYYLQSSLTFTHGRVYTGKIYHQWRGCQAQLIIMEPELCKEILNDKDTARRKREFNDYEKKIIGDGIATTLDVAKWMKSRKLANHAFHGESLKSMIPTMIVSAWTMLEGWRNYEGNDIEVFEEFRLLTWEVIAKTAFG